MPAVRAQYPLVRLKACTGVTNARGALDTAGVDPVADLP